MEQTYTKDELVKAMSEYNQNYFNNIDLFTPANKDVDNPLEIAEAQVNYLLSLVKPN